MAPFRGLARDRSWVHWAAARKDFATFSAAPNENAIGRHPLSGDSTKATGHLSRFRSAAPSVCVVTAPRHTEPEAKMLKSIADVLPRQAG